MSHGSKGRVDNRPFGPTVGSIKGNYSTPKVSRLGYDHLPREYTRHSASRKSAA